MEINQFNHTELLKRYEHLLNDCKYWHMIVIQNVEDLDRHAVLGTIMKSCKPESFIPVKYVSSRNSARFLVKNCEQAIQKLCFQNLIIRNPSNNDKPFEISIKLCYFNTADLKINIQQNIKHVLQKRYNSETGELNLENFARDAELEEYCSLSQPKLFFYIMHIAKDIPFKILKLSNNEIDSLSSMEALDGPTYPIITLDLRNNCIREISELDYLKHLDVVELWLDGNPICDRYSEITYAKSIKAHVKKLEKLDGINIKSHEFPPFRRNFLCDAAGHGLVDQFLEHYYTIFDSNNRILLKEIYHRDAFFSLTSMHIPRQKTSSTAQLNDYTKFARNLKQMSDLSKNTKQLFMGPYLISNVLSWLPQTIHDPYSFTADVMMHTEEMTILVVSGVFRELKEPDKLRGFSRTFVLLAGESGEYSIINDMLNVTNATTIQAARAFKLMKTPRLNLMDLPRPQSFKEVQDTLEAMKAITGLKMEWVRRCLEETDYDLKQALDVCIELLKLNKIPKSAFDSELKNKGTAKHKSKVKNTASASKSSKNQPTATLSSSDKRRSLGKSNSTTEIKSTSMALAVGIARPINRQTSPTPLKLQPSKSVKRRINDKESRTQVIDLTILDEEPVVRPPPEKKKANIPSLMDVDPSVIQPMPGNTIPASEVRNTEVGAPSSSAKPRVDLTDGSPIEQKFQPKSFNNEFAIIQGLIRKKNYEDAFLLTKELLLRNRLHYAAFEKVFLWYYVKDLNKAHALKNEILKVALTAKPFLSKWQLDLLFATCDCAHGDFSAGEVAFQNMIKARQRWARPITEFCKALLRRKENEKAKEFMKPFLTANHPLKQKMKRIVVVLNKEYKVDLLQ